MCSICVDSFMLENGERYCHVVNKDTGEPLYYPNLYITTQVRNRSESISTMKVIAGSISLLYRFFMRKEINIDERIQKKIFLAPHEIEDLIEFTSFNFRDGEDDNFRSSNVKKPTKYFRITTIANYLEWLCKIHLSHTGQKDTLKYILDFINNIKRKKPRNNDKYNMDIEIIIKENQELKVLVAELQEKLRKYTNPESCQKFYEKNKEKIIKESNERLKKNNKNDEWLQRLDTLKQSIEYWTNDENKSEKTIETVQLFYDQNFT